MRAYVLAVFAVGGLLLALFGLARLLKIPLLSDDSPHLGEPGVGAAVASLALLTGDVVLPVPSSALMILNGSLFGLVGGALLSLAGGEAAALFAFALGRRGGVALARRASPAARERAERLVAQHGALAIVVTRPVPVIAETAAIMAGAAGMPLGRLAAAAAIGSVPPAIAYAVVGAYTQQYEVLHLVLAGAVVFAAVFWLVDRRRRGRESSRGERGKSARSNTPETRS